MSPSLTKDIEHQKGVVEDNFPSNDFVDDQSTAESTVVSLGNKEGYPKSDHDEWLRQHGVAILADGDTSWSRRTETRIYKQTSSAKHDNKWQCKGDSPHEEPISWEFRRICHNERCESKDVYWMDPEPAACLDQVQLTGEYDNPAKLPTYQVDKERMDTRGCADKTVPCHGTNRRFVGLIKRVEEEMVKEKEEDDICPVCHGTALLLDDPCPLCRD